MWVRGLKLTREPESQSTEIVAPYVGAWIETGVNTNRASEVTMSHPMWVRGLKQRINEIITNNCTSHPMWVRGLKP